MWDLCAVAHGVSVGFVAFSICIGIERFIRFILTLMGMVPLHTRSIEISIAHPISVLWVVIRLLASISMAHAWNCSYEVHYILARSFVLSILCPSSSCSATSSTGNLAGIIRRGVDPGTTEYLEKSVTPHFSRRKSSSVSRSPLTLLGGARTISTMASEKIV